MKRLRNIYSSDWRPGALTALLALGLLLPLQLGAQEIGRFEVRSAEVTLRENVYYLDARVQYRLSDEVREALESGVSLTIELQIEVTRQRRFLPDSNVASLNQRYQLMYLALSDRYVVHNLNSGEQASFATLFAALNHLGRVMDLPVIDAALVSSDGPYNVRVRAVLDTRSFPGPLRLLIFWGDGWRIESDWYQWRLKD